MKTQRKTGVMSWALAAAVFLQGVGLVLLGRLTSGDAVQTVLVAVGFAVAALFAWNVRLELNHRIDMILVMGAFGGLGMLAGWWIDLGFEAPSRDATFHQVMGHCGEILGDASVDQHACCPPAKAIDSDSETNLVTSVLDASRAFLDRLGLGMAVSWMTALMLLGAIPPGLVATRCADLARESRKRWISTHVIGNLAMVIGMILIGHQLGPAVGKLAGSNVIGAHLAMLGGMLIGMEIGMLVGEAVLGLKPWRELRWNAN